MCAQRYENLDIWQLADELKEKTYELIDNTAARKDFAFCDQLRRSVSSATANISEGYGYYDHGLFAKHVRIAIASEIETLDHLDDGVKRRHWNDDAALPLKRLANRAIRAATSFLRHLETSEAPHKWPKRKRSRPRR
jgi:four helix bundle protein